jgi:hypothetical protein
MDGCGKVAGIVRSRRRGRRGRDVVPKEEEEGNITRKKIMMIWRVTDKVTHDTSHDKLTLSFSM